MSSILYSREDEISNEKRCLCLNLNISLQGQGPGSEWNSEMINSKKCNPIVPYLLTVFDIVFDGQVDAYKRTYFITQAHFISVVLKCTTLPQNDNKLSFLTSKILRIILIGNLRSTKIEISIQY